MAAAERQQETMLVRIRPVRKAKAPKVQRYMFEGQRYDADRGWYEVSKRTAEKLKKLNQDHYDPDSPPVFDVCTKDEAVQVEEREARAAERATAVRPNVTNRAARRQQRGAAGTAGAFTTRDLDRVRKAREEDAEMLDPDPDGLELEEDEGVETNIGRLPSNYQPVPPDESHDGDKGTHAYVNAKFEKREKRNNLPPPDESHDGDKGVHAYHNRTLKEGANLGSSDNPLQPEGDVGQEQSEVGGSGDYTDPGEKETGIGRKRTRK